MALRCRGFQTCVFTPRRRHSVCPAHVSSSICTTWQRSLAGPLWHSVTGNKAAALPLRMQQNWRKWRLHAIGMLKGSCYSNGGKSGRINALYSNKKCRLCGNGGSSVSTRVAGHVTPCVFQMAFVGTPMMPARKCRTHIPSGEEDKYCLHSKDEEAKRSGAPPEGVWQIRGQTVWSRTIFCRISIIHQHWVLFWNALSCCIKPHLMDLMSYECVLGKNEWKCVGAAASKMVQRNKRERNVFFCAFETSSVHRNADKRLRLGCLSQWAEGSGFIFSLFFVKFSDPPVSVWVFTRFSSSSHSPKASTLGWLVGACVTSPGWR